MGKPNRALWIAGGAAALVLAAAAFAVLRLPSTRAPSAPTPAALASKADKISAERLVGRWLRPDGGYVVEIRSAQVDGRLDDAYLNPRPINVSRADRVSRAFVVYSSLDYWLSGPLAEPFRELASEARRTRGFGDFWGHMLVARGTADVMIEEELCTWDWAAPSVIVEEAGGRMSQMDGSPLAHGGSVVTTNGLLHDELVARFRL